MTIGLIIQQPGWRWSDHIKPIAGTSSCQFHHTGFQLSGRVVVRMDDGTEFEVRPRDIFDIPPGHDAWVVGDEPSMGVNWGGFRGFGKPPVGDRVLATLLMTDIVNSTRIATRLGDAAWDQLLQRHNDTMREVLAAFRGAEVATTGDGFLATFDGAARALHAALAAHDAVRRIDLEIRAAVHTGEVEVILDNIRGVTVHEVARMLALAAPGEVLVSDTTRRLATTRGLAFDDRGRHALRGLSGKRRLFGLAAEPAASRRETDAPV